MCYSNSEHGNRFDGEKEFDGSILHPVLSIVGNASCRAANEKLVSETDE